MVSTLKMIKQKYYFRQKGHFKLFRANMLALIKARTFANVLLRKASLLERNTLAEETFELTYSSPSFDV